MKLLFIRHSLAVDRMKFSGDDLDRPLTKKGIKRAKKFFKKIKKIYPEIDVIYTSPAIRALQTANILNNFYNTKLIKTPFLLPGAEFKRLKFNNNIVAIVGHEPDLSEFIRTLTFNENIKLQKPSLAEVEDGVLKALIQHTHLKGV